MRTIKNFVRECDLYPIDGTVSFYGKARVITCKDGSVYLRSYDTIVGKIKDGRFHRLWDGYSATTIRHVNAFIAFHGIQGGGKAWWESMSVENVEKDENFMEEKFYCENCGEEINEDKIKTGSDGKSYCDDCFEELFFVCSECGNVCPMEECTYIRSENICVCEHCLDMEFTCCDRCGEFERSGDAVAVLISRYGETERWCQNCADWNTWTCEECDETYSSDVESNDGLCPNCYEPQSDLPMPLSKWVAPSGVKNYSYKPRPCFCPEYDEDEIYYGFELECEANGRDTDDWANTVNESLGYTYVKRDSSLDDGMEIVSHPATLAYHMSKWENFEKLFQEMREAGFRSHDTDTCGLHVHISLEPMEKRNAYAVHNLLVFFDRFWNELKRFSRRTEAKLDRWASRYNSKCVPYREIKKDAKGTSSANRYMAVNLANENTVEIRIFRGTLNIRTFFATLQLVKTLVERAIEIGYDAQRANEITWAELVKSNYTELNEYLKIRGLMEE